MPRERSLLASSFRDPRPVAVWGALALLLLFSLLSWRVGHWYRAQLMAEHRSQVAVETSLRGNALSLVIGRRLARLQGLRAFVVAELAQSEPPDPWPAFVSFASALYTDSQGVRGLSIAPAGVVRHVYPPAEHQILLGYDPLLDSRSEVRADVERARETGEITLTGPIELLQGGVGLVARQAVYHGGDYWGLVSLVLDWPCLLTDAGLDPQPERDLYALRDAEGRLRYGPANVLEQNPVIHTVELPDGVWELAAVPAEGWDAAIQRPWFVFQASSGIIAVLLAGVSFLFLNRQAGLALAVRQRTEEIAQGRALLEERVAQRTRELAALLQVSRSFSTTLELESLLTLILDELYELIGCDSVAIITADESGPAFVGYKGPAPRDQIFGIALAPDFLGGLEQLLGGEEVLIIDDLDDGSPRASRLLDLMGEEKRQVFSYARSWMGVPLRVHDQVIGWLRMDRAQPHYFTSEHSRLALSVVGQAAAALENARLYQQAQRLAVLEERQRLARDLHDSVSQALYGIALGARTARRLLDQDPKRAAEPLEYVLTLADGGLNEMRALIFELRPDSLEREGLVAALGKQAAAVQVRHGLEVHTELGDEPALSFAAKEALYRIVQEALTNVVKHAQAGRVEIRLSQSSVSVQLELSDDGVGFDARREYPGHLGLQTMRERAGRVGGRLEIESTPGAGTRLTVSVPWSG